MNDNNISSFGDILFRERNKRNMSLKELADYIGFDEHGKHLLSPSYLNRLEKNEADNPSFKNVCLLSKSLSLDLREVFKSFGYEELILDDKNLHLDRIQDIIRISDIKAPLIKVSEDWYMDDLLNFTEKEILISIIINIFNIGVCDDEEVIAYLTKVNENINDYRALRRETAYNKINEMCYYEDIPDTALKFCAFEGAEEIVEKAGLTMIDIYEVIKSFINESYDIDGNFKITYKDKGLILDCIKDEYNVKLTSIESIGKNS